MTVLPPSGDISSVVVDSQGADLLSARDQAIASLAGVAAAIAAKDATLWGPDAESEAANRLGWLDCVEVSAPLIPRIEALRDALHDEGLDRVVLAGMGGSSLAPEVIANSYGVPLVILDTTDVGQVSAALADQLERTVLVVSSKSGGTLETDSHRRIFLQAFRDLGLTDEEAHRRLVVVTDPGSPLSVEAETGGCRELFLADPNVGGRYSALTAFGLVPSGLAGAPIADLLDQAASVLPDLSLDVGNPGLLLGAALGGFGHVGHDKVVLADAGSGIVGLPDWIEQLIAESTGKQGRGLLPVALTGTDAPGFTEREDVHLISLGGQAPSTGTSVSGPLGAQFMVWEFATAVAGRVIGIDPFDQPNVQESKDNTRSVLDAAGGGDLPTTAALLTDGAVEVHGSDSGLLSGAADLTGALDAIVAAIPDHGYLAVMAYLDRGNDGAAASLRDLLAARTAHPVTFGWGPRFLHSTGQFHKGGPQVGAFVQITGSHTRDLEIPGQPFSLAKVQLAQAIGDAQALESRGRPFLRLHLTDRGAGLAQLLTAAAAVAS